MAGPEMSRRGSDSDVFIGFFCEHLRAMVASMPAARTVGKLGVVEQPYAHTVTKHNISPPDSTTCFDPLLASKENLPRRPLALSELEL